MAKLAQRADPGKVFPPTKLKRRRRKKQQQQQLVFIPL
jgi:hypothetical protein